MSVGADESGDMGRFVVLPEKVRTINLRLSDCLWVSTGLFVLSLRPVDKMSSGGLSLWSYIIEGSWRKL